MNDECDKNESNLNNIDFLKGYFSDEDESSIGAVKNYISNNNLA